LSDLFDIPDTIDFTSKDVDKLQLEEEEKIDENFKCHNDEYTQYYSFQSRYDLQEGLARTTLLTYKGRVIGYISIAMAHMRKENNEGMNSKETEGNIPALLISHLATHEDFLKKKIGSYLVSLAIKKAIEFSKKVGCRYVMLNPENEQGVRDFYEKLGFEYIPNIVDDKEKDAFILDIQQEKKS